MAIGTLLVYGTLRPNNRETVVLNGYKMYDLGWYPGIIETGDTDDIVVCERVVVKSEAHLKSLDNYEGCHGNTPSCLYHRKKVGDDWVYVYNNENHAIFCGEPVYSGDWLKYLDQGAGSNAQLVEA